MLIKNSIGITLFKILPKLICHFKEKLKSLNCISRFVPVHPGLPISLWTSLLELLAFGSSLAAHTVDAFRSSDSLRLQTLGRLLEGKLDRLALLQAAKAFHVQLALKGEHGARIQHQNHCFGGVCNTLELPDRQDRKSPIEKGGKKYFNILQIDY